MKNLLLLLVLVVLLSLHAVESAKVHRVPLKRKLVTPTYNSMGEGILKAGRRSKKTDGTELEIRKAASVYLAPIKVGTPGDNAKEFENEYELLLDTGSDTLLLFGEIKDAGPHGKKRNKYVSHGQFYDPAASESYKAYDEETKTGESVLEFFPYCDGSTYDGQMALETVTIGGKTLTDTPFAIIVGLNEVAEELVSSIFDMNGVLGLSFGDAHNKATTLLDKMIKANMFEEQMFSVYLSDNGEDGEVIFGGKNKDLYYSMHFVRLSASPLWRVKLERVQIGEKQRSALLGGTGTSLDKNTEVEFDTGSSLIYAPSPAIDKAIALTGGVKNDAEDGRVFIDCQKRSKLKNLDFIIDKRYFSFTPDEYFPVDPQDGVCRLIIRDSKIDNGIWFFGVPFFQKFYTIFDFEYERIGIGLAKHGKTPEEERGRQGGDGGDKRSRSTSRNRKRHPEVMAISSINNYFSNNTNFSSAT